MFWALLIYVLTGGADFGGGVWELFARGPRARAQREVIQHAIAPIWEANHVWLVVVIVLLFVAFPTAFAAIMTALFIPLVLMLIGIVLRGSAFAFRTYGIQSSAAEQWWSRIFAISSAISPITLGLVVGAINSGDLRVDPATDQVVTNFISAWLAPFPLAVGLLTLALCAFLAAVYLTCETDDPTLQDDFRRWALAAGVTVGILAWTALGLARRGAPSIYQALMGTWWALPFHLVTGGMALGTLAALWWRRFPTARVLAIVQTTLIMLGWGLAQYPYLVVPDLTLWNTAAPESVLRPLLIALVAGTIVIIPSFWYLYAVFKGRMESKS